MTETRATNITWHEGHVQRTDRERLLAQQGATVWFTGLSGSGKSTLAFTLEHALIERGRLAYVLDGDNIRHGLNKNLGFSPADRTENIRRIGEVAKLFTEAGVIVFTSDAAVASAKAGKKCILVREETNPEDVEGMRAAEGILTARGGMTSHAAVVARGMGRPCVVGAGEIRVDYEKQTMTARGVNSRIVAWGGM